MAPATQAASGLKNGHSASGRHPDSRPDISKLARNLAPRISVINAGIHLTEHAKSKNAVGVSGMRGEAPHGCIGLCGEPQGLPGLPKVRGAEHMSLLTGGGFSTPGEEHLRIISLDGDAP